MLGKILEFIRPEKKETEVSAAEPGTSGIPAEVERHRRTTWIPRLEDRAGEATNSRFSGVGVLPVGEEWPTCPNCDRPLQLFVQLSSEELPPEADEPFREGYLQMFYCTSIEPPCEVDLDSWDPFSTINLLRVLPLESSFQRLDEPPRDDVFPSKVIVSWEPADDYPNWEELEMLGVTVPDAQIDELGETYPRPGEKLLGWPFWVQAVEYPECRTCGETMRYVFQIDSEQNLPYMFGDVGVGHISICPNHPDELAFGWACY